MGHRRKFRIFRYSEKDHKHTCGKKSSMIDGALYLCAGPIDQDRSEYVRIVPCKRWGFIRSFERRESVECFDFGNEMLPNGYIFYNDAHLVLAGKKVPQKRIRIFDNVGFPEESFYVQIADKK